MHLEILPLSDSKTVPEDRQNIRRLIRNSLAESAVGAGPPSLRQSAFPGEVAAADVQGRYDFDLAEFPLFFLKKNRKRSSGAPLRYTDTIRGKDGEGVRRSWTAYPGPFGFGGLTAQLLLYELLQLYVEQGARGSQIQFGTLRSLFLRRGHRNPSKRDYLRLRRDFDILRGYDFHCENAFWDRRRQAYVDMKWRLFGSVFFFKGSAGGAADELPFGFIEVSPVLQQVARTRGFFALGFDQRFMYSLRPLEQRLAVYLAKKFLSQKVHRRYVEDLAGALPIEAARPRDVRATLKKTAEGLLAKRLPILGAFALEAARNGRQLAVFHRAAPVKQALRLRSYAAERFAPAVACLVRRITEAVGDEDDVLWWTQCVRRLGAGAVDRALGQLREARSAQAVRNPGGLLTKIFKDLAAEAGVTLR